MRKIKKILNGNNLFVNKIEDEKGYELNYKKGKNEWVTTHINNLQGIFDIPCDKELDMRINTTHMNLLKDDDIIVYDSKSKLFKLYCYDLLYKRAKELISEYLREELIDYYKGCDLEQIKNNKDFMVLEYIMINFKDEKVTFGFQSKLTTEDDYTCALFNVEDIIDIKKLEKYIKEQFKDFLGTVSFACMQRPGREDFEYSIFTTSVDGYSKIYTYKLFKECDFIKNDNCIENKGWW